MLLKQARFRPSTSRPGPSNTWRADNLRQTHSLQSSRGPLILQKWAQLYKPARSIVIRKCTLIYNGNLFAKNAAGASPNLWWITRKFYKNTSTFSKTSHANSEKNSLKPRGNSKPTKITKLTKNRHWRTKFINWKRSSTALNARAMTPGRIKRKTNFPTTAKSTT